MNLLNILNEELSSKEDICVLEEGLFDVSPAIAMFAFKDNVINKLSSAAEKISHPVSSAVGNVIAGVEKVKAKTKGRSGDKDDDTVYKLTKEQKKAMAYIYRKYGAEMVNEITKFREDVMIPYSIIKRSVARNKTLTNKEIFGMTKEEYYKYRESGRKKIEKKGTYFKDAKEAREKNSNARETLQLAQKRYEDFKSGKVVDLTSTNIEKVFDEIGIGRNNLNGWTETELEKTATEIKRVANLLKDEKKLGLDGDIRVAGKNGSKNAVYQSREQLEHYLNKLQERGYSYAKGISTEDSNHHGSFKSAFAVYMLRRSEIKNIKQNTSNSFYKKFYEKVLKDAIDTAKKISDEKFEDYMSLKGSIDLNQFEKKIWALKPTGIAYSGNIDDWYLKIKPEDFKEIKYYKKSDKIIAAEKDMDKSLKQLERNLKKIMSDEDLAYCRKYRLFNNFLTVKELRDSKNMFKGAEDIKKQETTAEEGADVSTLINAALSKEYSSIKELEEARDRIKKAIRGKQLSNEDKEKLNQLEKRVNPKIEKPATESSEEKVLKKELLNIVNKINNNEYTNTTPANEDLAKLERVAKKLKSLNSSYFRSLEGSVSEARGKIVSFLSNNE